MSRVNNKKRFVDKVAIADFIKLASTPGLDLFNSVELVQLEQNLNSDMARYPWLNQLIVSCTKNFTAMSAERINKLRQLDQDYDDARDYDVAGYEEVKDLNDHEIKQLCEQEEMKLRLLEHQHTSMDSELIDQNQLELEKERLERENEQIMQQIKDKLPVICDQLLQLRLYLVESQGDDQINRFGQNVKHKLQQLNQIKPDLNRLISELLVRNNHDSDVKLVYLAKTMYGHKLSEFLDQLQTINQICNDAIVFLKTKFYGGFLIRKMVNEMNIITSQIDRSIHMNNVNIDRQMLSAESSELHVIKQMLDFDFNSELTKMKTILNDRLKLFDETNDL